MSWWGEIAQLAVDYYGNQQNQHGADAAQHGAQAGLDWTKQVYQDAQGNFAPYLAAGTTGLNGLSALAGGDYSGFANSPDYLYAREQAQYGNDHSAAARGQLYDPGTQLELAHQMNGIASQNLGNYRNSLQYLSTLGAGAATNLGSIGNGLAGNVMQGYGNIANAQQQGYDSNGQLAASLGNLFGRYYGQNNQQLTDSSYGSNSAGNTGGGGNTYGFGYGGGNYSDYNSDPWSG